MVALGRSFLRGRASLLSLLLLRAIRQEEELCPVRWYLLNYHTIHTELFSYPSQRSPICEARGEQKVTDDGFREEMTPTQGKHSRAIEEDLFDIGRSSTHHHHETFSACNLEERRESTGSVERREEDHDR